MEMIIIIVVLVLLITFLIPSLSLAPYVPMWAKDLPRLMEVMKLQPGETMVDLGCGDGKVVLHAAKYEPKAQAVGIELGLPMYLICQLRKLITRRKNAQFHFSNALKEDLSQYDIIYLYSLPERIQKLLIDKFKKELRPGARVISYAFTLAGEEPVVMNRPSEKHLPIYEYRFDTKA